jgi:hypothetical protein
MPAYWFMHNMYALARNSRKYADRDKRTEKIQCLEYDFLAPDSINEMIQALKLFKQFTGKAFLQKFEPDKTLSESACIQIGQKLLEERNPIVEELSILAEGFENSERNVRLIKVLNAYHLFKELISYYAVCQLLEFIKSRTFKNLDQVQKALPTRLRLTEWVNVGGQLIQQSSLNGCILQIQKGTMRNWEQLHLFYAKQGENYPKDKLQHALAAAETIQGLHIRKMSKVQMKTFLLESLSTAEWMTQGIYDSRSKDYSNSFRRMVYESPEEMNAVNGSLEDNSFIREEKGSLIRYKREVNKLIKNLGL